MALKFLLDRKNMYIYPWYISDLTATKDIARIAGGLRVKKVFMILEDGVLHFYYEINSANKIGRYFLKKILEDKNFYKKTIRKIYYLSEDLIFFCQSTSNLKLKELNDNELLKIYAIYTRKLRSLRVWGWIPVFMDGLDSNFLSDYINDYLKKYLKKIQGEDGASKYYSLLTSSDKMSEVQQEELARLNLIQDITKKDYSRIVKLLKDNKGDELFKSYPRIRKKINSHLKNFGWLTYGYSGPTMTAEYLFKLIKQNIEKGDIEKQKENLIGHYKGIYWQKNELMAKLSMSEKFKYILEVSSELMFIKDYRKGIYQKSYVYMDRVMNEIGKRLGVSNLGMKYLSLDEIKIAIKKKNKTGIAQIAQQRTKKCCYEVENGKIKIYEGNSCETAIKRNVKAKETFISEEKELKGLVAYGGVVRGVVKVVLVEGDVKKVNNGDVLVSSATNPDLILAMKKAAAFVTDTGGITSHAAIISRELKKPCIVGTKIATHVLKDGDLVEVDADKGVVTILKK